MPRHRHRPPLHQRAWLRSATLVGASVTRDNCNITPTREPILAVVAVEAAATWESVNMFLGRPNANLANDGCRGEEDSYG